MKAILVRDGLKWHAKWSDLQSFAQGTMWSFTPLHPDTDINNLKESNIVEIELVSVNTLDDENFNHTYYAKIIN